MGDEHYYTILERRVEDIDTLTCDDLTQPHLGNQRWKKYHYRKGIIHPGTFTYRSPEGCRRKQLKLPVELGVHDFREEAALLDYAKKMIKGVRDGDSEIPRHVERAPVGIVWVKVTISGKVVPWPARVMTPDEANAWLDSQCGEVQRSASHVVVELLCFDMHHVVKYIPRSDCLRATETESEQMVTSWKEHIDDGRPLYMWQLCLIAGLSWAMAYVDKDDDRHWACIYHRIDNDQFVPEVLRVYPWNGFPLGHIEDEGLFRDLPSCRDGSECKENGRKCDGRRVVSLGLRHLDRRNFELPRPLFIPDPTGPLQTPAENDSDVDVTTPPAAAAAVPATAGPSTSRMTRQTRATKSPGGMITPQKRKKPTSAPASKEPEVVVIRSDDKDDLLHRDSAELENLAAAFERAVGGLEGMELISNLGTDLVARLRLQGELTPAQLHYANEMVQSEIARAEADITATQNAFGGEVFRMEVVGKVGRYVDEAQFVEDLREVDPEHAETLQPLLVTLRDKRAAVTALKAWEPLNKKLSSSGVVGRAKV